MRKKNEKYEKERKGERERERENVSLVFLQSLKKQGSEETRKS